ncbi:MAG TPA: PAS domain S-box protein [Kofleriaceae bacterium]|jgi:PAS domain S-box-containing protein|nr:PAS domain S-box protein [Kofleriaceae bacterium]
MELADEHFRLLVESVADYAIYLLEPDGTIRSWNRGAQRLKGYTAAEIVGKSFAEFFTAEDRASGKPARLLATALRDGRIEDVGWRIRKDGSQFWASAVITALYDRTGAHIGFAKVTRDLTDRSYRAFIEATHAIVWTTDATGQPSADSPSWREFSGQSVDEWRSLRGWETIHPADLERFRAAWNQAKQDGTPFVAEYRLRRHDGAYVWFEGRAIPFFDVEGRVREWFGVTLDISARKQAELETQRALTLWTTTLRSIGDAVISTDAAGRVRFLNRVAEQLTGWRGDEAVGRSLTEVFPIFNEETGAVVENPVDKVLREGVVVGLANHTVLRRRDGSELPIDDSAAPILDPVGAIEGVVLVFRDASEGKRELVRRGFLTTATEQLLAADDYRDALTRIVQLAVPRLADWAGVDLAEPGTTRISQLAVAHVDPAKLELAHAFSRRYPLDPGRPAGVAQVMRTGQSAFYPELPPEVLDLAAVDDEHRRVLRALDLRSVLIVPLRGKGPVFGTISFVLAGSDRRYTRRDLELAEDLARRAGLIIERRRLEEEAEQANRMKDEFLATMSHELRTPLQAILGYASMLERGIARDPAKAIAAILRNATAQTRLVEDVLDVSRIASGKLQLAMTRIDIVAAIRAALESVRPAALARRIRITEHLPANLGEVLGDFERLQQVVWNLLSNAVKFTPMDGAIEVRAEGVDSTLRVIVRDTGKGIAPEHLTAIFERFRQVDSTTTREHRGLGLGLAIVRYLVEAHGGTVRAESPGPGQGATFIVTLPMRTDPLTAADRTRDARRPLDVERLRGIRILLVEDDDEARELLADVLAETGASVARAASAAEGMAQLLVEPPHVLISDIGMPFEDGNEFLRRVRALPPERGGDVPAIALTAYARVEDRRATEDAGFQLHVVKPVRPDHLVAAIESCVRIR